MIRTHWQRVQDDALVPLRPAEAVRPGARPRRGRDRRERDRVERGRLGLRVDPIRYDADLAGGLYAPRTPLIGLPHTDYARRTRQGALAQYVRLPAACLVNLPPNVGPVQAAGFACAAMTAYQALFGVGGLRPGQRLFVNGASSAVGAFAVQLAKAAGCWVSGSASGRNREFVEGMGVDEVRRGAYLIVPHTYADLQATFLPSVVS